MTRQPRLSGDSPPQTQTPEEVAGGVGMRLLGMTPVGRVPG